MKKRLLVVLAVVLVHGTFARGDGVKDDTAQVQGKWQVVSGEMQGKEVPEDKIRNLVYVFDGDKMIEKTGKKSVEQRFTLDSTRDPKELNIIEKITRHDGVTGQKREVERTFPGIYALEGNKLTICYNPRKGARPTEFRTSLDSHLVLFVLRREIP